MARVQSQGVRRRVATEGWVVAGFVHRTSREGDPQLHTHCLVPNLVRRTGDGRHVAFDAGPLFEWARAAGSIYQNQLQRTLVAAAGGGAGVRIGTTPGRWTVSAGLSCGRSPSAAPRSRPSWRPRGRCMSRRRCVCRPTTRRRWPPGPGKDHSLTPSLLAGRWQSEADAGRPGDRGRPGAGGVLRRARLGGAGLGGDQPPRWSIPRWGCAPTRPVSPRRMWSSTSAPSRAAGCRPRGDHRHGRPVPRPRIWRCG